MMKRDRVRATAASIMSVFLTLVAAPFTWADDAPTIGVVASLSSFAANYGRATLEGAEVAADELAQRGTPVKLVVEDDQSIMKNVLSAYTKLTSIDHARAIIGGTWWGNSISKKATSDHIPLISCETLYNDDAVLSENYFILQGDLAQWVKVYEPLVKKRGWKRGAVVRFSSGFGATIAREVEQLFSQEGRVFAGTVEYSSIDMSDSADIILRLKKLHPDVVYIDAQPAGLANFMKKLVESGWSSLPIITNSILDNVIRDKLFDVTLVKESYFTRRASFSPEFEKLFQEKFKRAPTLNADLGYYAVHLAYQALATSNPIDFLKHQPHVSGKSFSFDEKNVERGVLQEVYEVVDGTARKWPVASAGRENT